jgi:hypothetical protein
MSNPKPYRSAMDAPIEIHAARAGSPEVATRVWPDEVDSVTRRLAEQGYTVSSITSDND